MKSYLCFLALLTLIAAPTASAGWAGYSTGSSCQRAVYQSAITEYFSPGMVGNGSTAESSDLTMICGVDRPYSGVDGPGTRADYTRMTAAAWISDNSSDEDVSARVQACSDTYTSCVYTPVVTSSTGSSGIQGLVASSYWYIGSRNAVAFEVTLPDKDSTSSKIIAVRTEFFF